MTINLEDWQHSHHFNEGNPLAERNTRLAVLLTALMMVAEIIGGWMYNSMALLADGWHMSSHVLALGLSALAYRTARRLKHDARFAFGTWKIEIIGGYTSAIFLIGVAGVMLYQSIERLISPSIIHYEQAIAIAAGGLVINLACAWLLNDAHGHHHTHHGHHHDHDHHHDLNLRSAYLHVMADAATSVLAMIALFGGKLWGANWLDPAMGIIGSALVVVWAYQLMIETGKVLLDAEMDAPVVAEIREVILMSPIPAHIIDLHVWRVSRNKYACILSLVTTESVNAHYFREQLSVHDELVHITVEIHQLTQL
ncbi:MAG TPA: cation transporter [Methylococcaceae bacterium]|nr:cation transporter [Methylococcaceae bacterium]